MNKSKCSLFLGFVFLTLSTVGADEPARWPSWRGSRDSGSVETGSYPSDLLGKNILWKTPLPGRGCSTPIIWDRTVYLTTPDKGKDSVLAIGWSGRPRWQVAFGPENPGKHKNASGSNASPATDGEGIFVYFKSGTLAALELDGTIRWQTNLVKRFGPDTLFWDHGTSPVLTSRDVIMTRMHKGESWLAAFDKRSGKIRWKVARNYKTPTEGDHGYTTPLVIQHRGAEALLVWGAQHVTVHDAVDGELLWTCGGFNPESKSLWPAIASPVVSGDVAVIAFGRNDRGIPRLHGIRLGGDGEVTESHRIWKRADTGTFVPTPAEYRGRVYLLRDRGEVECIDPANGKTFWQGAFPKNRASFYASPLVAGGKLYAAREDGVVYVASIKDRFELLSENDMGERVIASPVPASNRVFIRGQQHLFCIGR